MKKILLTILFITQIFANEIKDDELKAMIGQMVMVGFSSSDPNDKWVDQLAIDAKNRRLGGIMLLARNISSKANLKKLTSKFSTLNLPNKLFISIDEEGGNISRFKNFDDFLHFASAYEVGQKQNLSQAHKTYKSMATQLKSLNINLNFAPVVDVYNPKSSIIGQKNRAFSVNSDEVSAYASEFIRAFDEVGVLSVLKHFPGHGNAIKDTHKEKTVVNNYDFDELKPYFELIKRKQAKIVMIAHVFVPSLDDANPAIFSKQIVTNLLKGSLGFDGIAISDDLLMGAIKEHSLEERIVKSINAGVDIVLISEYFLNKSNSIKIANDIIYNAVKSGKIKENRIQDAYERIIKVKKLL
ncbi:glycosyl hydrolase, family 3 [Campylobacter iguaniorum]|uniref:beta-N-acetylhexosaminidase n=1 Tax=Campylobacter iguaniorum TaxID=1244531 RepID=A0A076FBY8_9BACT|nr:glycoside hydrolase family 3 N-terminal domain-containing protein [Campylobacter iguaniorum]AII14932.1 glycosyl hydrolase, family 3 [Campylobacter iguaniorum]